jgi:hypothetical protein
MKNSLGLLLLFLLSISSCRKDDTAFDGPSVADIYNEFKVEETFSANTDTVNFASNESVIFTATFSKIVDWNITITGTTSRAKKNISGSSKIINATNATWNGSTSLFPIFKSENCKVMLTLKDLPDTFLLNVRIAAPKSINGFTIANFETGLNPAWPKFIQSGANMDFKVKTDTLAPEGAKYLNMAGTVNWDYLIGLVDFPAQAYNSAITFPLAGNPEAVYFNCLIYGVPNTNPSIVLFQFKEDENANGTFTAASEDEYDYQINVDWAGWKLVSLKYSDFKYLINGNPATPKGNGIQNPDKLSKISMLHLADPNAGFASTKIDMLIFTDNKPFEP